MDGRQIFDTIGLVSSGLALPFWYLIIYFFLRQILGFKHKKFILVLVAVFLAIAKYLSSEIFLPVYLQIVIDNTLWLLAIYFLCNGNIMVKLYAFIIQASTVLLTSIAFIGVDYKISALLIKNLNMASAGDVLLLFIVDIARDFTNLLILYLILSRMTKLLCFSGTTLNKYQGIYLLVPNFAIYSMAVLFYSVQEIKINYRDYYLLTIFPDIYFVVPIISISMLVSLLIIAFIFGKMLEGEEVKQNNLLMRQQFRQQLNHSKSIEELYKGIRGVSHDMKNHIICLRHLAEENDMDEIKKYLDNMENTITTLNLEIKTGNAIADAVINEKYILAKKQGIKFEHDFILPVDILIEPMDLCVILSNALDNSIEACQRISEPSVHKEICITSKLKDMYLLIEVSNSTVHKVKYINDKITSKKPDRINHGIGISNIIAAVKKYNGFVDIVEEKNRFTINLMLKVK